MATNPFAEFATQPQTSAPNPFAQFAPSASNGGIPGPRRAWSDVPMEAVSNLPSSAGNFVGSMWEAVTSPVQTVKGILDIGAGALQNITPKVVRDFVNRFETNPDAAQRAVSTANAVGGMYAQRYGTEEGFKEALATDPIGVLADFSTLLSGGAALTSKLSAVSKPLETAAKFTNPAAPVVAAVGYGSGLAAKGLGNAVDFAQGNRPGTRAGNIIRNALTEEGRTPQNITAAQNALRNAPADATVRQALSDVVAPQIQHLGRVVEAQTSPGASMTTRQAQEASRLARLQAVTPDLDAAIAARSAAAGPLYAAATQPSTLVVTAPLVQKIDSIVQANPGNVKLVSALNQVKAGVEASTNAQQLSSVIDNIKDLMAAKDNKFIVKNLADVKKDVAAALPGYDVAQQKFAAMSPEVNQAQVLTKMREVLEQPLGVGERAGAFATATGKGETALLKKSTGEARYSTLADVLTPEQMKVVGDITSELRRNESMMKQAKEGADAMNLIMEANKSKFRLPDFMSVKVTLANQILRVMEGRLNQKVLSELEKGFKSATSFEELMRKVPASERLEVLKALGDVKNQLSPTKLNVYIQAQNALAAEREKQNALAK